MNRVRVTETMLRSSLVVLLLWDGDRQGTISGGRDTLPSSGASRRQDVLGEMWTMVKLAARSADSVVRVVMVVCPLGGCGTGDDVLFFCWRCD